MSLIDKTYFQFPLAVPMAGDSGQNALQYYIDFAEKKYLNYALGNDLYNAFIAGLGETTPDAKWTNLRDGANFTTTDLNGNTVTIKWNGLKNADKQSFLAYFAYFHFLNENKEKFGNGVILAGSENSTPADARPKMINAWNEGINLYGKAAVNYYGQISGIVTVIGSRAFDYAYCYDYAWNLEPTLFNFIYHTNKETPGTYPNWVFTDLGKMNIFSL